MTRRELIDYCLTYPDAYEDYPFDAVTGLANPDFLIEIDGIAVVEDK